MEQDQEKKRRQEAIRLYELGNTVTKICDQLQVSRPWFYKWLKRFQSGEENWFCEHSRRPHRIANKTSLEQERVVIGIRRRLEKAKYSQRGAMAIQWEMEKLGFEPLPTWTIDRILKRHHLVRVKRKYQPSGKQYPDLKKIFSDSIQQADLLGPRHIQKDGHFYSLNVIDLESYLAAINPCRSKADVAIAENLLRSWQTIGKPDFLQMDNELSFRGSNRHPHSFGLVIRMCLALNVQPIFIPIAEPWRNGTVEKLQDVFDKVFFRRQFFENYQQLCQEARLFERFRNENHRCSAIGGQAPVAFVKEHNITLNRLPKTLSLPQIDLSLADGYVHLIRFVRSDRRLDIFGEKLPVPKSTQYEYVIATICTKTQSLHVKLGPETLRSFEYRIPIDYARKC
jgi:hypothetical protein